MVGVLRRLGYACLCLSLPGSSPRGTVLRNATAERLRALISENLSRLRAVLEFNEDNGLLLFRVSSDVVPFGSHEVNRVAWWDEFAPDLARIGAFARARGMRLSMHPGQYTVLSARDPGVLAASVRDLSYHARFLDALGLDASHKIVVHVGGAYGDKPSALRRWAAAYAELPPPVRARLVLENDERLFGAEDVLSLSAKTGVPVVLDVFHHRVHAAGADLPQLLARAFATWRPERDGLPKVHFSTQAEDQRPGAHADYVDAEEFRAFLHVAPDVPFDCMLEAKAKERAVFRLRRELQLDMAAHPWAGRQV